MKLYRYMYKCSLFSIFKFLSFYYYIHYNAWRRVSSMLIEQYNDTFEIRIGLKLHSFPFFLLISFFTVSISTELRSKNHSLSDCECVAIRKFRKSSEWLVFSFRFFFLSYSSYNLTFLHFTVSYKRHFHSLFVLYCVL